MVIVLRGLDEFVFWNFWRGSFIRLALVEEPRPDIVIAAESEPFTKVSQDSIGMIKH